MTYETRRESQDAIRAMPPALPASYSIAVLQSDALDLAVLAFDRLRRPVRIHARSRGRRVPSPSAQEPAPSSLKIGAAGCACGVQRRLAGDDSGARMSAAAPRARLVPRSDVVLLEDGRRGAPARRGGAKPCSRRQPHGRTPPTGRLCASRPDLRRARRGHGGRLRGRARRDQRRRGIDGCDVRRARPVCSCPQPPREHDEHGAPLVLDRRCSLLALGSAWVPDQIDASYGDFRIEPDSVRAPFAPSRRRARRRAVRRRRRPALRGPLPRRGRGARCPRQPARRAPPRRARPARHLRDPRCLASPRRRRPDHLRDEPGRKDDARAGAAPGRDGSCSPKP